MRAGHIPVIEGGLLMQIIAFGGFMKYLANLSRPGLGFGG